MMELDSAFRTGSEYDGGTWASVGGWARCGSAGSAVVQRRAVGQWAALVIGVAALRCGDPQRGDMA